TEPLQFQAYVNMLAKRGIALDWSFAKFCEVAHLNSSALKEALYAEIPNLDPNWKQLYQEKKEEYLNLLLTGKIELMPGAEDPLKELAAAGIRRSVVTHSILDHTMAIRSQHPVLRSIP